METMPGTYIPKVDSGSDRTDELINVMIFPTICEFEQLMINYETGTIVGDNEVRFVYSNWNEAFPVEVYLNGGVRMLSSDQYTVDHAMGRITLQTDLEPGDSVQATYSFNYFPLEILEGFIKRATIVVNTAGTGDVTAYTIDTAPDNYLGVIADIVVSMCMERLILDYDIWKGRLIYAISQNGLYEGGDSIVSQLETVKKNAEERAYMTINNPKFRMPSRLAKPTEHYYEALLVGSSARYTNGAGMSYGPLRGAKFNRLVGSVPRS